MRSCLIGGAGFIGTELTKLLVKSGRDVVVMGRSPRSARELAAGVRYESGDYGDVERLRSVLAGADEVVDLAYSTAPQTSYADPVYDVVSNVPAAVTLLKEAAKHRLTKVLLVSSGGTVYGVARTLPITEDHGTQPISPYGITKLAIENYGWMYRALLDVPVVVVRPGNAYGEGQRMLSGQGFIATAMRRISAGQAVEMFGATGTLRDYIHVSDVASGIMAALDAGRPGTAYNIGTGEGLNNIDVLRLIEPHAANAGLAVRKRLLPERKFDVPANILDSARLRAVSGWRPMIGIHEGIAGLWAAILRNPA